MEIKNNIEKLKVLLVGDIMLDHYIFGDVTKISPEAPVPIVNITNETYMLGGCGNVLQNLISIGIKDIILVTAYNKNDVAGRIIETKLQDFKIKRIIGKKTKTIIKQRIMSNYRHMQLLRCDTETIEESPIFVKSDNYDIIIVSDYNKGFITRSIMNELNNLDSKVIVDPKPENIHLYDNVYMLTPNEKEYLQIVNSGVYANLDVEYLLETQGKKGMTLHDISSTRKWPCKNTNPIEVFNVTGAGDVILATMATCISLFPNAHPSNFLSTLNCCGQYVVQQSGTSIISQVKFINFLQQNGPF